MSSLTPARETRDARQHHSCLRRSARSQLLAAGLLRLLALVLAADVSGSMHAAMDVAVVAGAIEHPDDDCEHDGHECPPGCLSCHCAHAAAWSGPVVSWLDTEPTPPTCSAAPVEYSANTPTCPEASRLDRPPRSSAKLA